MKVEWINPFIRSTQRAFVDMMDLTPTIGKPFVKRPSHDFASVLQTSAFVELRGGPAGMVVLSLSDAASLGIASRLLDKTILRVDHDCIDAIGEMANMIVGAAKAELSAEQPISVTIPRVIRSCYMNYPAGLPVLVIPFEAAVGRFILQVALSQMPLARAA